MSAAGAVILSVGIFAIIAVGPVGYLILAGFVPLIIWSIAFAIRRLHDRDKGLVWALIFGLAPLVLSELAKAFAGIPGLGFALLSLAASLVGLVLWAWGWVEIGFRRGSKGPNRFGAGDELSSDSARAVAS